MRHLILCKIVLCAVVCLPGLAKGNDYFIAAQDRSVKQYLDNVTIYHTDKIVEYIRSGRIDSAKFDVKYTLDRFPNHPKGLQLAGLVAHLTKEPSFAIQYYERALQLYPQYAVTYAQYGAFLVGSGRIDGGIMRLKRAIEIDPELALAHAYLAKAYYKAGNVELAREAAERARMLGHRGKMY